MERVPADLQRESYDFPEGKIRLINWREVKPDPPGGWPGIHGNVETEQIIRRDTMGSKQTVMGRSVYHPGSSHDPHCHFCAEEFIYCLSGKVVVGNGDKEYLFTPGDVQFAAIGEIHWLRNPFNEPVEFLWIYTGCAMPFESGYATPDHFDAAFDIIKKNQIPK